MPKYYTVDEVAEIFKVKCSTVVDWVKEGKLRGSKLASNKLIRIEEEAIRDFFQRCEVGKEEL